MNIRHHIRGLLLVSTALLLHFPAAWAQQPPAVSQFTPSNISQLAPIFTVVLGGAVEGAGHYQNVSSHSYIQSGTSLYTIDGWGGIAKLDLTRKGERIWYNDLGRRNIDAWLQASRGMVLDGNTLFAAGSDGQLHWIDTNTGSLVRSVQTVDPKTGADIVAPPLIAENLVIVAGSGDDRVGPLYIVAYDKVTGELAWKADPGELSGLSAVVRQPGLYDAERGQVIWTFAFPPIAVPEIERQAWAGNGILALERETGALRWTQREAPSALARPESGPLHLVPATTDLPARLVQFSGDGRFTIFDAASGATLAAASSYDLDASQIRFSMGQHEDLQITAPTDTCENGWSVLSFASAISSSAGLAYGSNANACVTGIGHIMAPKTDVNWLGAYYAEHDASLGVLTAADLATAEIVAQRVFPAPLVGGVLVAGNGLLFVGTADGMLHVLDEQTLEPMSSTHLAALSSVNPMTFELEGRQYLAVVVGGNALGPYLAYRSPDLDMSEGLLVLVVMGLKEQ
ncbi:outer membrane protein assembly factor BamB family protein [Devosia sp. A449]